MGQFFQYEDLDRNKISTILRPIIFCTSETQALYLLSDYKIVSVNEPLSQIMKEYEFHERCYFIEQEFQNIIQQYEQSLILKDYEMLFDPSYQLNVFKVFVNANRKKQLAVLWNGKHDYRRIWFAEPEYLDYKSYVISDYDVSCII